jgi:hypothetical protein
MGLSVVAAAAFGTVGRLYTVSADYMADAGRPASWNRYTYAEFWPDPDDDREDGQHPKVLLVHPDLPDDVDVDIDIEPGAIGIVPDHLRYTGLYTAIAGAVVPAGSPEDHSAQMAKGVRPEGPEGSGGIQTPEGHKGPKGSGGSGGAQSPKSLQIPKADADADASGDESGDAHVTDAWANEVELHRETGGSAVQVSDEGVHVRTKQRPPGRVRRKSGSPRRVKRAVADGPRSVLALVPVYTDAPTPYDPEDIKEAIWTQADAVFNGSSYGRVSIPLERGVIAVVNTGVSIGSFGVCDYTGYVGAILSNWGSPSFYHTGTEVQQPVDPATFDHIVTFLPPESGCTWAGLAYVPGSRAWLRTSNPVVVAHELG